MQFAQQAPTTGYKQYHHRAFQRVTINLAGRLMTANHEEFDCIAMDMSPGDVVLTSTARPRVGDRIIAYIDHVGRLEGTVQLLVGAAFVIQIVATERKREKLAAQLTWIANKHELGLPEDRRHDRLSPRNTLTQVTLEDGSQQVCRIIDLSLSGAAVDMHSRLPLGTVVLLGSMKGRVVRHFREGIALEFYGVQTREALSEFL